MTEYELLDSVANYTEAGTSALMAYLTIVSGYLVAAYVAGRNLNGMQNAIVSILFLFMTSMFSFSAFANFSRAAVVVDKLEAMNPSEKFFLDAWVAQATLAILVVGIIASLKFMWDIRHEKSI